MAKACMWHYNLYKIYNCKQVFFTCSLKQLEQWYTRIMYFYIFNFVLKASER